MIFICEPQCRGISHVKVNSGFINGFCLAYPKDKIFFFTDTSHFNEIRDLLKDEKVYSKNIKHISINYDADKSFSLGGIARYYFLIKRVFNEALSMDVNKIFFLSTNGVILYTIKKLKRQKRYRDMCCTFVLHGELEDVANVDYREAYVPTVKSWLTKINFNEFATKMVENRKKILPYIIFKTRGLLLFPFSRLYNSYSLIFKRLLRVKRMLILKHSGQYKYVVLSPHILINASKCLNTKCLNFYIIIMPVIFCKPQLAPSNKFIKFAVFGYGDSGQMQRMLTLLSKRKITKLYEIKIISMDNRGTEGFSNITYVSDGKVLSRKKMEEATRDVDVFINLYDKNRHRFGCSLSIFEAFSYLKPVLHLSNPGYNYFNKTNKPIGFRTENLNGFVDKMCDMIENYSMYKKQLSRFRKNMLGYRKDYDIKNNLDKLKKSFTF